MADFSPLLPGDPARLGGLELLGRLGEGGQGVVYLARTPMDVRVAVKWLRPSGQDGFGRFLREAEVAQRVAPFCTAAVLSTGVEQGRPYIVSEYVEGRSLERVVREDGPLAGGDLERLAIGTATALAAVHQAGVVHRDFKPGNVIMGATGPRVIDFGIARALGPATLTSSTQIGTPAYMAPEQVMGRGVGPAADLFAWAGTMVFASCGRAPFGVDGAHAVMSRVLSARPDLGSLDGPLGDLVLRCLAKEPSSRPAAMDVIACLLRNPEPGSDALAAGARQAVPGERSAAAPAGPLAAGPDGPLAAAPAGSLAGGPGDEVRRAGRSRPPVAAVLAATAALAVTAVLVAGLAAVPGWLRRPAPSPPSNAVASSPPAAPSEIALPGGAITLHERPSDPITLTAYEVHDKKLDEDVDYARRSLRGTFDPYPDNLESLVSPDGRFLAGRPDDYTSDGYDSLLITDRRDGSSFRVKTVRKPLDTSLRAWSRDGSRILLNLDRKTEDERGEDVWTTLGFAVVDVARREADVVRVADDAVRGGNFGWDGAERGVVAVYGGNEGLRFFDAAGRRTRDVPGIGPLASGTLGIFSPSGRAFVTDCPGSDDHCLWDTATGEQVRRFSSDCDKVLGWYDESHLYCWEHDNGSDDEVRVVAFDGRLTHKLLEAAGELEVSPYFTLTPTTS
ncbi:putative Ser/Thr protein kinase [Nonomuraea thailandensis]|uniref:Ser/Thr protein kinase n=1 Tax=Nonomuraea thailandensis TaxID=1188745 RepID=A0A9X2K219_9ACTN|nr:serine/threonine-protein kinase [Nonomuraea thailandensis]MCP2357907.1 putative Ser/Thr protein kinase [Nonomuraea thailandensis]